MLDMSRMSPILTTSSEIWALAGVITASAMAASKPKRVRCMRSSLAALVRAVDRYGEIIRRARKVVNEGDAGSHFCRAESKTPSRFSRERVPLDLRARQYIRGRSRPVKVAVARYGCSACLKVFGRFLAVLRAAHDFERDFLTLVQRVETRAFDGADMDEHVLAAVIRLNEAVAFLRIKPLYGALAHGSCPSVSACVEAARHCAKPGFIDVLESSLAGRVTTRAKSSAENSMQAI